MTPDEMLVKISCAAHEKAVDVLLINDKEENDEIGQLIGNKIILNRNSRDTLSLVFTVAHLFGHYCQFSNSNKYLHLVSAVKAPPITANDNFKTEFWEYEREAFQIGKSLMLLGFPVDKEIDRKYQIFMMTDFKHFWNYVTTGISSTPGAFNKKLVENYTAFFPLAEEIGPLPIPEFSNIKDSGFLVKIY